MSKMNIQEQTCFSKWWQTRYLETIVDMLRWKVFSSLTTGPFLEDAWMPLVNGKYSVFIFFTTPGMEVDGGNWTRDFRTHSLFNIFCLAQSREWAPNSRLSPKLAIASLGKHNLEIVQIVSLTCTHWKTDQQMLVNSYQYNDGGDFISFR